MARKYNILYKEANELMHLSSIDYVIEIIRKEKENLKIKKDKNSKTVSIDTEYLVDNFYIKRLLGIVSEMYKCKSEDLISDNSRRITKAKKICYKIMKFRLNMQHNEIGYVFGKNDSTVCRAISSLNKEEKNNPDFKDKCREAEDKMEDVISKRNKKIQPQ